MIFLSIWTRLIRYLRGSRTSESHTCSNPLDMILNAGPTCFPFKLSKKSTASIFFTSLNFSCPKCIQILSKASKSTSHFHNYYAKTTLLAMKSNSISTSSESKSLITFQSMRRSTARWIPSHGKTLPKLGNSQHIPTLKNAWRKFISISSVKFYGGSTIYLSRKL